MHGEGAAVLKSDIKVCTQSNYVSVTLKDLVGAI